MLNGSALLLLLAGAMELAWSYAWANFLTTGALGRSFPPGSAALSFAVAAALTTAASGRTLRVIQAAGLQVLGFVPFAWATYRRFEAWGASFPGGSPTSGSAWALLLVVLWALLFWGGGVAAARRPRDYSTLCRRFDLGVAALLFLLLLDFALTYEKLKKPDTAALWLFGGFLLLGLFAIGLARRSEGAEAEFLSGKRGVGTLLAFAAALLLLGVGVLLFCMPLLTAAADAGYEGLKALSGTSRLWGGLELVRFLFRRRGGAAEGTRGEGSSPLRALPEQRAEGWMDAAVRVLAWAGALLLAAALLAVAALLLAAFVRWLFSRTKGRAPEPFGLDLLRTWEKLRGAASVLLRRLHGPRNATEAYRALLGWGRWSGVVRRPSESALEYACRLTGRFPGNRNDILSVVGAFHREVYGGEKRRADLAAARTALRRMRSPSLWPARLKGWFSGPSRSGL